MRHPLFAGSLYCVHLSNARKQWVKGVRNSSENSSKERADWNDLCHAAALHKNRRLHKNGGFCTKSRRVF